MAAFLLFAAAFVADAKQFQVTALDGQTVTGTLVELSDKQIVLQTGGPTKTFTSAQVRFIVPVDDKSALRASGRAPGELGKRPAVWVETIDGSRISGATFTVTKGSAELMLTTGTTLKLSTKAIRLVEFAASDGSLPTWVSDLKSDQAGDLLVVRKRDVIDYVEGAAGDVNDGTVNFSVDNENVTVTRARVAGIVYLHPPGNPELPEPACVYEDATGWRIKAMSVALANGELKIVTTFGAELTRPLESLKLLDFSPGRMIYLSGLPIASSEWTPLVDFGKQADSMPKFYRAREDRGLDTDALQVSGKTYPKGIAIPARTALVYKIAGKGKRFKALAGIDDSVHETGAVRLVISGDGKTLFDGRIVGREPPVDLDLDVSGVKRLNILVDFGEKLDVGNYLDLCDARIVK
jgi:hypothetical protein